MQINYNIIINKEIDTMHKMIKDVKKEVMTEMINWQKDSEGRLEREFESRGDEGKMHEKISLLSNYFDYSLFSQWQIPELESRIEETLLWAKEKDQKPEKALSLMDSVVGWSLKGIWIKVMRNAFLLQWFPNVDLRKYHLQSEEKMRQILKRLEEVITEIECMVQA